MVAVSIILAVLLILFLVGKKSVHQELLIEASPDEVWQVLTHRDDMSTWNHILVPLDGELAENSTINYSFTEKEGKSSEMKAKVRKLIPNQLLNQSGGIPGILTFDHRYILQSQGAHTMLTIHEDYKGIMVPFWNPDGVEEAYGRLAEALRQRVLTLKNSQ